MTLTPCCHQIWSQRAKSNTASLGHLGPKLRRPPPNLTIFEWSLLPEGRERRTRPQAQVSGDSGQSLETSAALGRVDGPWGQDRTAGAWLLGQM